MNHTPGPWKLNDPNQDTDEELSVIAVQDERIICRIGDGDLTDPECYPNAYLIAAAPDMLEVLNLCKRNVQAQLYMLPVDASQEKDILSSWIGSITGAITKAEGKEFPS